MKNNTLGNIAVSNSKRPRARFNLSSDLHSTMDFGSILPARVHMMIPNSKEVVSSRERILCSPMLAPTMGRMSLKAYHNFIRISDICPNFAAMLSQEAISRGDLQFVPQSVPSINLNSLSFFVLFGAYLNVYKSSTGDDSNASNVVSSNVYSGTTGVLVSDSDLSNLGLLTKGSAIPSINVGPAFSIDTKLFTGSNEYHRIPLSNPQNATFYPIDPTCDFFKSASPEYDLSDVTPQNADYVIPVTVSSTHYYLCFRLSDFGKRLRKVLIGCGYQIDFVNATPVSILPLLAFYKSYFDVFGLTLYLNWEQTECSRLIESTSLNPVNSFGDYWSASWGVTDTTRYGFLIRFIVNELSRCYYTDEQDFVSSHVRNTSVSPSPSAFVNSIDTDVDQNNNNNPNITNPQNVNEPSGLAIPGGQSGHSYINSVLHGQLDSELLKRLYRWTNRNTIAGRRIAELLKAQGLGSYVKECKSDFIGSFELPIDVYDGLSNSDTYSPAADSGAPLGERFGNGQASSSDDRNKNCERSFVFESNEFGYWITLFTIVPKGGYAEAVDPSVFALSKFQFPHPDFDSLGYEFTSKSLVVGSMPFADFQSSSGKLSDSFGLVPRLFPWKFGRNVANGDFTRRGVRDTFAPYYLDKIIDVGSRIILDKTTGTTSKDFQVQREFTPSMLPIAGNVWRYPTRYPFISRFNRIFNRAFASMEHLSMISVQNMGTFEMFSTSDDEFILHAVFDVNYFAPMLPVEDSFETYDDDNAVNGSMGKA